MTIEFSEEYIQNCFRNRVLKTQKQLAVYETLRNTTEQERKFYGTLTAKMIRASADSLDWNKISRFAPMRIFSDKFLEDFKTEINFSALADNDTNSQGYL